jgi:hypothetical protein
MDGSFISQIDNTGAMTNMMVDKSQYNLMRGNDTYKSADFADQSIASGFVDGLTKTLDGLEKSTGNDYIARQTGVSISVEGTTSDVTFGSGKTRQKGEGTMTVGANFDNGKSATLGEFSVVSGANGNGVLPDGTYTTGKPYTHNKTCSYTDATGTYFKIPLIPNKSIGIPSGKAGRPDLLIHPVGACGTMTEGCVGIKKDAASFYQLVHRNLNTKINVTIKFNGNANVKTQLKNKKSYK